MTQQLIAGVVGGVIILLVFVWLARNSERVHQVALRWIDATPAELDQARRKRGSRGAPPAPTGQASSGRGHFVASPATPPMAPARPAAPSTPDRASATLPAVPRTGSVHSPGSPAPQPVTKPGWWEGRRTVVLDPASSEPFADDFPSLDDYVDIDYLKPGAIRSVEPPADSQEGILHVRHGNQSRQFVVREGLLFEPSRFPGLAARLHFTERDGVLYASAEPGSVAVKLGDLVLGAIPLPVRINDVVRNGSWAFSVDEAPAAVLDSLVSKPSEWPYAVEVSSRGDCIAITSVRADLRVRQLGTACFVPRGRRPAEDALQLARAAAINAGLAVGSWDLSLCGLDASGQVTFAGPLIAHAEAPSGAARRGTALRVTLLDGTELRFSFI